MLSDHEESPAGWEMRRRELRAAAGQDPCTARRPGSRAAGLPHAAHARPRRLARCGRPSLRLPHWPRRAAPRQGPESRGAATPVLRLPRPTIPGRRLGLQRRWLYVLAAILQRCTGKWATLLPPDAMFVMSSEIGIPRGMTACSRRSPPCSSCCCGCYTATPPAVISPMYRACGARRRPTVQPVPDSPHARPAWGGHIEAGAPAHHPPAGADPGGDPRDHAYPSRHGLAGVCTALVTTQPCRAPTTASWMPTPTGVSECFPEPLMLFP
jgi:hypothetical protein